MAAAAVISGAPSPRLAPGTSGCTRSSLGGPPPSPCPPVTPPRVPPSGARSTNRDSRAGSVRLQHHHLPVLPEDVPERVGDLAERRPRPSPCRNLGHNGFLSPLN